MNRLIGIPASDGIAFGTAFILDRRTVQTPKYHIESDKVQAEISRFHGALREADQQLQRIKEKLCSVGGEEHTLILEAHQLILKDEQLAAQVVHHIQEDRINVEWALVRAVAQIKKLFDVVEDQYFRERRSDIAFVADHLLHTLTGTRPTPDKPPHGSIVVAHDLSPAETAELYRFRVRAFVTDRGGRLSHTSIMARSLSIPAVVGLEQAMTTVGSGDSLIVDGFRGELLVSPDPTTVLRYQRRIQRRAQRVRGLRRERELPAETLDGVRVRLMANIELSDEIPNALFHGAEGIGLYRTEFLYLGHKALPQEDDHLQDALAVLRLCDSIPITFRTMDLGADKLPGGNTPGRQINPALGMRSIRLCLEHPDLFRPQLRGLLRAAVHGSIRIMFPMIMGVEELRRARATLQNCRNELLAEGVQVPPVPVGVMVEMPSAAITADLLAREADFLSIGTNDLTQYTLATDRVNQAVSHLFQPHHPAVLRLIRLVVEAADRAHIPVSVCGEMAGDPLMTLLLLGLGLRVLSMGALSIPLVKRIVRGVRASDAGELAARLLQMRTPQEVEAELLDCMESLLPEKFMALLAGRDEETLA